MHITITTTWTETANFQGKQLELSVLHAYLTGFSFPVTLKELFCVGHGRFENSINHSSRDVV